MVFPSRVNLGRITPPRYPTTSSNPTEKCCGRQIGLATFPLYSRFGKWLVLLGYTRSITYTGSVCVNTSTTVTHVVVRSKSHSIKSANAIHILFPVFLSVARTWNLYTYGEKQKKKKESKFRHKVLLHGNQIKTKKFIFFSRHNYKAGDGCCSQQITNFHSRLSSADYSLD